MPPCLRGEAFLPYLAAGRNGDTKRSLSCPPLPRAHIDLMCLGHSLGLKGGLKAVEEALGIVRPPSVRGLSGYLRRPRLWKEYRSGSLGSLKTLLEYNLQDVLNLEEILVRLVNRRIARDGLPFGPLGCAGRSAAALAAGEALARLGRVTGFW